MATVEILKELVNGVLVDLDLYQPQDSIFGAAVTLLKSADSDL